MEVFTLAAYDDAKIIIDSICGIPPAPDSPLYPEYLKAVDLQLEYMSRPQTEHGIKKISLGDYSVEYSGNSSDAASSGIVSPYAAAVLNSIYGGLRSAEVVF